MKIIAKNQFLCEELDDKTLRQQLKAYGLDARRLSRFTMLALLGALPLKSQIAPNTPIYLGSSFSSPSKFNKMFQQLNQHDLPSPLDFMANLNNAATFQLAQALETTGTTLFVAVDEQNVEQPLKLAQLDLATHSAQTALVGWAYESPNSKEIEGSLWIYLERA